MSYLIVLNHHRHYGNVTVENKSFPDYNSFGTGSIQNKNEIEPFVILFNLQSSSSQAEPVYQKTSLRTVAAHAP